jgi:hypothetical protein
MKNFKKIALGLLVGAMAISFSAFTNANSHSLKTSKNSKGQTTYMEYYYRALPGGHDTNPADYIYSTNPGNGCNSKSGDVCQAEFTTTNPPVDGSAPSGSPSYDTGSDVSGDWNGN